MNEEILKQYIRPVTDTDKAQLTWFSFSKFDTLRNCPYQYNEKYNHKLYPSDSSLPLELGSLCHYILEQKGLALKKGLDPNYDILLEILHKGTTQVDDKTKQPISGIDFLKKKYFENWYAKDDATGMTYEDKMQIFHDVIETEMMENDGWEPMYFEMPFEFVWDNKAIIHGFIDRVDCKNGEYRTIDYKTSKKPYPDSKLSTSLQFGIYALALLQQFDKLPIENIYRFILIDDKQYALTKGWEKRLVKILNRLFDQLEEYTEKKEWIPKPSPLCYWCSYCSNNPNAHQYKRICDYYLLWTPANKTFERKKEWDSGKKDKNKNSGRKLIF